MSHRKSIDAEEKVEIKQKLKAKYLGKRELIGSLNSKQLRGITGSVIIEVLGQSKPDTEEKPSQDEKPKEPENKEEEKPEVPEDSAQPEGEASPATDERPSST